ncbi:hypothetical protein JCM8547_005975 [Rhodosporidiobolus lusitaniae]
MSFSQGYTVDPPSYTAPAQPNKKYGSTVDSSAQEPLLAGEGAAPRDAWAEEGEEEELEDDFKIGATVSQSAVEIRQSFVRKVYAVLSVQILATTLVGFVMRQAAIVDWTRTHPGLMLIPALGAIAAMLATFWKRHSSPANVLLLGLFTLFEAVTLGSTVSYVDSGVVLQALVATSLVFVGLTIFTFQSKYDFSHMGTYLYAGLLGFFFVSLVGIFLPYNSTWDIFMAGLGVLLFSAYIVFDTHMLINRLHVDDWVVAVISLYLDILNLFLQILRLLSDAQDR